MYVDKKDHVSRYIPRKKLLVDDKENPVGILPQAFEMRVDKEEKDLSVNWLEHFGNNYQQNIAHMVQSFTLSWNRQGAKIGKGSAFSVANVGVLENKCAQIGQKSVKVLLDEKPKNSNPSHARIIRLPINNDEVMQVLASDVFKLI